MIQTRSLLLGAAALLTLSACDFIRFPGDGGPPPVTPDSGPAVPPGAPGPRRLIMTAGCTRPTTINNDRWAHPALDD